MCIIPSSLFLRWCGTYDCLVEDSATIATRNQFVTTAINFGVRFARLSC